MPEENQTLEEVQAQLAEERRIREELEVEKQLAEEKANTALRDLIAIKKGKKRDEVTPDDETPETNPEIEAIKAENARLRELDAQRAEEIRINNELLRANLARNTGGTAMGGSSEATKEEPSKAPEYWSDEQKAFMRARGFTDEQIAQAAKNAQGIIS